MTKVKNYPDDIPDFKLQPQDYPHDGVIGFIIVKENKDGSRSVLTKEGKIVCVPKDKTVDSVCGALFKVPYAEFSKIPEEE